MLFTSKQIMAVKTLPRQPAVCMAGVMTG